MMTGCPKATIEQLLNKPSRRVSVDATVEGGTAQMVFQALGAKVYDDLVAGFRRRRRTRTTVVWGFRRSSRPR